MMLHQLDRQSLVDSLARKIVLNYQTNCQNGGDFSLLLPGGNSPIALFKRLASLQHDWSRCYFFLGDERFVDVQDKLSNRGMIEREFFANISTDQNKVIFPRTDLSLEQSAMDYHHQLVRYLKHHQLIECAIIGMGADGHTLSIFPGQSEEAMKNLLYFPVIRPDCSRLSATWSLLDYTKSINVFAPGSEKYQVFGQMQSDVHSSFPVVKLKSMSFKTSWYLSIDE